MMILIGKPYISDFLIKTIKDNNFPVVATAEAKQLISDQTLNWLSEAEAIDIIKNNPNHLIYSNSENTISWIENNLNTSNRFKQIQYFKNKIAFRELLKDIYPNYFFKGVKYEELETISVNDLQFPLIIKPAIGFFSLGVHKVDTASEWQGIIRKIKNDIEHIKGFYPIEVLNTSDFIIEASINGEEFAIDCYYNNKGEAVILNIMHHIFSCDKDVSDRVYSTSKEIVTSNLKLIQNLVDRIGKKTNLRNFPIHIEVRIDTNSTIIPIEVNPMRFGGWCTTSDISWYAFGINSYEYFFNNKKPDWDKIFKGKEQKKYSLILLDNNSGILDTEIASFDYEKLLDDFENPLLLRKITIGEYPIFGFLFTETTIGNEDELITILTSNLKKYIVTK